MQVSGRPTPLPLNEDGLDGPVPAAPPRGERLRKALSRVNPSAAGISQAASPSRENLAAGGREASGPLPPIADLDLPTWIQPFTMPSNARFTRTPDYLLRERALAGRSAPAERSATATRAGTATAGGPAPTAEPRAKAALSRARHERSPEEAASAASAPPSPKGPPALSEAAPDADAPHLPATIRHLNGLIRVGSEEPAAPSDQDNRPLLATGAPAAPSESGWTAGDFLAMAFPSVRIVQAGFAWQPLANGPDLLARSTLPASRPDVIPDFEPDHTAPTPVPVAPVRPPAPASRAVQVFAEPGAYVPPPLWLLAEPAFSEPAYEASAEFLDKSSVTLQQTLHDFGVRGEIIDANPGPVVTLYELEPAPGTKSSRVTSLSNDIARSMSAVSARVAVVPGRNVIGIELPNVTRETVYLRELLEAGEFSNSKHRLAVCLGKNIGGEPIIADLARMPHLLVAGTTGSGKSVAINTMILSLLYAHSPEQCRLIMVDPKMLELSVYEGIPHLLSPVVTDPKKAVIALRWAVREMEERYKKMSALGVRNIDGYNERVGELAARGETVTRPMPAGFNKGSGETVFEDEIMDLTPLPYIVVIVDEMADLMMVAGKDIEGAIQRLAQMARAAGIHLIMATQRPSVDVITGTIKANFPTRISFQVTSKIDSRTILGEMGAEQLLGQGDMLYMMGGGRITRVHGPFVSDAEVEKVVAHLKAQGRPEYLDAVTADGDELLPTGPGAAAADSDEAVFDKGAMATSFGDDSQDPYDQAIAVVMRDKKASTSYIQRRLGIGYNRAASIMERMEKEGIVGPANHAGKREILRAGYEAPDGM